MTVICSWKLTRRSRHAAFSRMQKASKPPDYLQTRHPPAMAVSRQITGSLHVPDLPSQPKACNHQ